MSKILKISLCKDITIELFMTLIFILLEWYINSWLATLLYLLIYVMYIILKQKDLINMKENIKILIKS